MSDGRTSVSSFLLVLPSNQLTCPTAYKSEESAYWMGLEHGPLAPALRTLLQYCLVIVSTLKEAVPGPIHARCG
jgi:hypothetical protein